MCEKKMNTNDKRAYVLHGLKVGLLVSIPAAVLIFGLCYWASTLSTPTASSLAFMFRPWWSNWRPALIIGVPLFVIFGVAGALKARLGLDDDKK
jgi:hypothetical protein